MPTTTGLLDAVNQDADHHGPFSTPSTKTPTATTTTSLVSPYEAPHHLLELFDFEEPTRAVSMSTTLGSEGSLTRRLSSSCGPTRPSRGWCRRQDAAPRADDHDLRQGRPSVRWRTRPPRLCLWGRSQGSSATPVGQDWLTVRAHRPPLGASWTRCRARRPPPQASRTHCRARRPHLQVGRTEAQGLSTTPVGRSDWVAGASTTPAGNSVWL